MDAAQPRPKAVLRRAVCGSLTAALLVGGSWGAASPAAALPADTQDDLTETDWYSAAPGSWYAALPTLPDVYRDWSNGSPGSWTRPVRRVPISARYGIRGDWAAGHHTGIDLAVPVGTPVRSVGTGTVVRAGRSGDYGKAVTVRMDDGNYTLFAHLSRIRVHRGERVRAGTVLGASGNTGRSTGPHLHFEVRAERGYGSDINPVAYLAQRGVRFP
ncbi:M23 family metallopeptidase [Streptomyces sp. TR06-5]|uniref:M23 family metallopeptidase n=1 Tax=Streptomyces sp. TR06-5 TaxID=3385976 RepID=UPI0039A316BE